MEKPPVPYKSEGKNFLTNPPKQGTFGMPGLTFTPFPAYAAENYDAAHEVAIKEDLDHKAKLKGGAFKIHTATLSQPFDVNPYFSDKGGHDRVICI